MKKESKGISTSQVKVKEVGTLNTREVAKFIKDHSTSS